MLKRIRLTNFFSFQDVTIDFEKDVNLLVGINGAGKSNLFKAIQLLKIGFTGNTEDNALFRLIVEEWGGFDNIYFKGNKESDGQRKIGLEFVFDTQLITNIKNLSEIFKGDFSYKIEIFKNPSFENYFLREELIDLSTQKTINLRLDVEKEVKEKLPKKNIKKQNQENNPWTKLFDLVTESSVEKLRKNELALPKFIGSLDEFSVFSFLLKEFIQNISIYEYLDTTKNSKIRKASSSSATIKKLLPDGKNLPQLLHTLKLKHKSVYRQIVKSLQDINPNFNGFDYAYPQKSNHRLSC